MVFVVQHKPTVSNSVEVGKDEDQTTTTTTTPSPSPSPLPTLVYAHKAILKSRGSYFERMFESNFKEKDMVSGYESTFNLYPPLYS